MYDVDKKEAFQVFDGAFSRCSWSPVDSSRVAVEKVYGQWHHEIWLTDLN
jgi:hypothetical protein